MPCCFPTLQLLRLFLPVMITALPVVAFSNEVSFERDIQPIFAEKCGGCHGQELHKGGLDLSSLASIAAGGETGEPLVADSLDDSWLWMMIDGEEMPPAEATQLTESERETIRDWIRDAAAGQIAAATSEDTIDQHDVLPIVLLRCVTCHGARLQEGGLDLRTREKMLAGGQGGPAIVPGQADESPMIQRIESEACPPQHLLLKFFVRRPPRHEVDQLRKWIDAGAPKGNVQLDVAGSQPDPLVSDEDRQHWAFQPPRRPQSGHRIDDFIAAKLAEHNIPFSPVADRDTLIRRAYIDLIGIPPDLQSWQRWRHSEDPDWYEQLIEHLLASPHYGERWGRYWLDLAGYADSEGGISADPLRPVAWKYRDYVIRSFNEDKPYDRFLTEQLAGDELVDYENADAVTDSTIQNLVATGFLRMGIDETGSRTMNFVPERLKVISDAINIVSAGVMGLTMECARCHSHKYDPIPQRDYYRFKAIFQGALDEHDWSTFKNRKLQLATAEQQRRIKEINPPLEREIKKLQSTQRKLTAESQRVLLQHHYPDQSAEANDATLVALRVADNQRTLPQRKLVMKLQKAEVLSDAEQPQRYLDLLEEIASLEREVQRLRRKLVPPPTIRALWDFGRPSPTYLLRRGEHNKPGPLVGPGVPSVLTDGRTPFEYQPPFPDGTPKTGRRLAFARWLTQPDHPLTARVMVNRIWHHHFGTGLVKDLGNFGRQGEPPSHPELLDWLATEFVERGWSVKAMHRLIMTSRVYRQQSRVTEQHLAADPQNRLLSRMPLRRMDAEALRDSILKIAGKLDHNGGGIPDPVSIGRDGLVSSEPHADGLWRRSVYLQYRRTAIPTMMDTFDYPRMGPNCLSRNVSVVSPQSLLLMNNEHVRDLASAVAQRVDARCGKGRSHRETITAVYQLVLQREPDPQQLELATAALKQIESEWDGDRRQSLETFCHTILNSAAFLYVD